MRGRARYAGRALLALVLSTAALVSPNSGATESPKGGVTVRRIGPGAYYKRIYRPEKRWRIHVITVKLAKPSSIDVALAGDELGHSEVLSSLAARHGAIAAINGDFGTRDRRPWNIYAEDGNLIQTERSWGRALTIGATEEEAFIGHPHLIAKLVPRGGKAIRIRRVNNGRPGKRQVALFTRAARVVEDPPMHSCSARLLPRGKPRINEFGAVERRFEVGASRCGEAKMRLQNGAVIAARRSGTKAEAIKALVPGQRAVLKWSLPIDDTLDAIGGNPMIVDNGKVMKEVVHDCGYLCKLHPRSAVGITKDNRVLFVVVDGRAEKISGMYLHELAKFFVNQGAERAMTFDGGGAAEMWIKGEIVNTPSDGRERPLVNALLLLPQAEDADLSQVQPYGQPSLATHSVTSRTLAAQTFDAAAADPGSLGGLMDFLDRRGVDLPPWGEQVVSDLRSR